ncbi:MAG: hypothetical protein HeimC2_28370 [Candidatus Heimdallarchaeota archaeon LC_2]|nr:MAG: hypothetical protein HeimC2_28370 [Candidatus Heimdallarchaeota archaeon LC_2]
MTKRDGVPKNQHYMNVGYLRRFSIDPNLKEREKLMIYRFGKGNNNFTEVKIVSQCSDLFYYSRINAVKFEKTLKILEDKFSEILDKLDENQELSGEDEAILLRGLIIQHLRTTAYRTEIEYIEVEKGEYREYENSDRIIDDAFRVYTLTKMVDDSGRHYSNLSSAVESGFRWGSPIDPKWKFINLILDVSKISTHRFVTSCRPVLLFETPDSEIVFSLIILPYSPEKVLIAYYEDYHELIEGKVGNISDIDYINSHIVIRAGDAILSDIKIQRNEKNSDVLDKIGNKSNLGYSNEEGINLEITTYKNQISFLKSK